MSKLPKFPKPRTTVSVLACFIVFVVWAVGDLLMDDRPRRERINRED